MTTKTNFKLFYLRLFYFFAISMFYILPTNADESLYSHAIAQLQQKFANNEQKLLFQSRNHRVYLHGEKKDCVVINLHGLYQSPKDQQEIAEYFFKSGCNVISPLLVGHWEQNETAFSEIGFEAWISQIEEILKIALNLGEKIILAGHSNGGLVAFNIAARNPSLISALVLFSPALKLTKTTLWLAEVGSTLNLFSNKKTGIDFEYDHYKKPAYAGLLVRNLINSTFGESEQDRKNVYLNFKTPALIFSTAEDDVISNDEILETQKLNPHIFKVIAYGKGSGVYHDNIQRGAKDVVINAPKSWVNPHLPELQSIISQFLLKSDILKVK